MVKLQLGKDTKMFCSGELIKLGLKNKLSF